MEHPAASGRRVSGLGELGRALPTNPVLLVLTSIGRFLAGMFVAATRLGFGTARGEQAARYELEARLYDGLAVAAIHDTRPLLNGVATLRSVSGGPAGAVQAIRWSAGVHQCPARDDGSPQLSRRARPGRVIAVQLGDPRLASHVTWVGPVASALAGRSHRNSELLRLAQHDRNLPLYNYIISLVINCADLLNRGHVLQARDLYETGLGRLAAAHLADHAYSLIGIVSDAKRGRVAETDVQLQRSAQDPVFGAGTLRISLLSAAAQVAVEQRDLGETFDRVAADFAALNLNPRLLHLHQRPIYVALAYGRIEQVLAAPAEPAYGRARCRPARCGAVGQGDHRP